MFTSCEQYIHHTATVEVPKVATPVTFGISRPDGLQLSGGCYFRGGS